MSHPDDPAIRRGVIFTFSCDKCKRRPKIDGWCQIRDLAIEHLRKCGGDEINITKEVGGKVVEKSRIKRFEMNKTKNLS